MAVVLECDIQKAVVLEWNIVKWLWYWNATYKRLWNSKMAVVLEWDIVIKRLVLDSKRLKECGITH